MPSSAGWRSARSRRFLLVFLRWVMVLAVLWPLYGGQVRAHWGEMRPRLGCASR